MKIEIKWISEILINMIFNCINIRLVNIIIRRNRSDCKREMEMDRMNSQIDKIYSRKLEIYKI